MRRFLTLSLALKVSWLLLSVSVLFYTLYLYDGTPATKDAELILLYGMLTLSFPASLIVPLILGAIGYLLGVWGITFSIPSSYLTNAVEWLVLLGLGYLQWFVILPRFWHKFRGSG